MQVKTTATLSDNSANNTSCISCAELAAATEAELAAFYTAVQMRNGASRANAAAELWLQAFASADLHSRAIGRELRKVTIKAAALLAKQTSPCVEQLPAMGYVA